MELNIKLSEADYLEYLLFSASKSDRIKKQTTRNILIVTFAFLGLSFLFFTVSNDMMMYAYAILGILTPIFYPIYAKRRYYNHCKKFIAETYKDRLDEPRKIIFDENGIYCFDDYSETKMKFSIIENITETNQYFYLKIKGSQSLIIPKSNVADVDVVKTHLKALADKLKIDYIKNIK